MKKKAKRKSLTAVKKKHRGPKAGIKNSLVKSKLFKPDNSKFDLMRQAVVAVLWRYEAINLTNLKKETKQEAGDTITADFDKYFDLVTDFLRERKLMEEIAGEGKTVFRLNQQLDS